MRKLPLVAALLASALSPVAALAAGDPGMGRILAQHWCNTCHAGAGSGTASDSAPPLATAVRQSGRTPEMLRGWLADPHGRMPNLSLTRSEIDDLVAYLVTLQRR